VGNTFRAWDFNGGIDIGSRLNLFHIAIRFFNLYDVLIVIRLG
jgi:hypothetical protein